VSAFVPAFVARQCRSIFGDKIAAFAENGIAFAEDNIAVEHGSINLFGDRWAFKKRSDPGPGKLVA
jgi:hypothetical protein